MRTPIITKNIKMPIIDKSRIKRFPHKGSFYRNIIDTSLPPSQQTEGSKKEYIKANVDCHVMESHVSQVGGFNQASYKIFMAFDLNASSTDGSTIDLENGSDILLENLSDIMLESSKTAEYFSEENTPIRSGVIFESNLYGLPVIGEVIGVIPSQLGACVIYIKDVNN